ncbi:unnamed protein product [Brassica rapa]|uniref:Uncharacterized protein n=1 Tax=Brassica campestris TaxID=3711 RepID=A0A8D9H9I6_BRACM|nr:unnamed protein product [Brassica rapa]
MEACTPRRQDRRSVAEEAKPPPGDMSRRRGFGSLHPPVNNFRLHTTAPSHRANRTLIQPELRQGKPGEDNGKTWTQKNRRPYEGLRQRHVRIRAGRSPET